MGLLLAPYKAFSMKEQTSQGIIVVKNSSYGNMESPGRARKRCCWAVGQALQPCLCPHTCRIWWEAWMGGSAEGPCPVLLPHLTCGHYVTSPVEAPQGSQHRPGAANSIGDCHLPWSRVRKCNPHTQRSENPTSFV